MTIEDFRSRFSDIYEGNPWFGESIQVKLNNLSKDKCFIKPAGKGHSIAELVMHMIAWREYLVEKLNGNKTYKIQLNTEMDWPNAEGGKWDEIRHRLENTQSSIMNQLEGKDDDFLKVHFNDKGHSFQVLLEGIIQHDLYHLGQIGLVSSLTK